MTSTLYATELLGELTTARERPRSDDVGTIRRQSKVARQNLKPPQRTRVRRWRGTVKIFVFHERGA